MLAELFETQQRQLTHFYEQIDLECCEQLVDLIFETAGVLYFCGIGKSGFIAQKIAATMLSTGTKAYFLPPIDALHGDLGMLDAHDLVLLFSNSGETGELLQLLPFLRNKRVKIVAITSNGSSSLAKGADFAMPLPLVGELCPFDLAPTTSTEVQLLFGDVLAMALMKRRHFTLDQYAENHPLGQIGRRASMKVSDLMLDLTRTPLCQAEQTLQEVLFEFTSKRCGCLIIVNQKKQIQGIFTDGDLRRALQEKGGNVLDVKLSELMTSTPKAIYEDDLAWNAVQLMESDQKHPVMVLPVIDRSTHSLLGIIKMHDLIQAGL